MVEANKYKILLNKLRQEASTGLDGSPGDILAQECLYVIERDLLPTIQKLEDEIERLKDIIGCR